MNGAYWQSSAFPHFSRFRRQSIRKIIGLIKVDKMDAKGNNIISKFPARVLFHVLSMDLVIYRVLVSFMVCFLYSAY
jgi:hypothetical protein